MRSMRLSRMGACSGAIYLYMFPYFHYNGNMESKDVITALSALAQESRLAVFRLLVQAGPAGLSAGRIAETLAIPPSSLSFHLKELNRTGLVESRQESRFIIYSAHFDTMNGIVAYLTENCCGGGSSEPVCHPDRSDTPRNPA